MGLKSILDQIRVANFSFARRWIDWIPANIDAACASRSPDRRINASRRVRQSPDSFGVVFARIIFAEHGTIRIA